MLLCNHGLNQGCIYAKPEGARITFTKMMDVDSYLNKLLSSDAVREYVVRHFHRLSKVLSHPACEIIPQIKFDLDLIEVSNDYCFRISTRQFERSVPPADGLAIVSPRAYLPYNPSTQPQPGFFRDGVLNCFPRNEIRVNFLNKYYQCLVACRMPQKVRKLVVAGPKDSGKTSWASVFHRIIPPSNIASITSERHFSAAMLKEDTQLIILDDWSADTIGSDLAKTILQGGWLVTAVKHQSPRCLRNNSPFFITTNAVPKFGDEDENVKRRIAVFQTTSLPNTVIGVDQWIYSHAMDCVAWVAEEINANIALVDPSELWYENPDENEGVITTDDGQDLFDAQLLKEITHADLDQANSISQPSPSDNVVHRSYIMEANKARLARKRRRHPDNFDSSSGEEENERSVTNLEDTVDQEDDSDNDVFSANIMDTVLGRCSQGEGRNKTILSSSASPPHHHHSYTDEDNAVHATAVDSEHNDGVANANNEHLQLPQSTSHSLTSTEDPGRTSRAYLPVENEVGTRESALPSTSTRVQGAGPSSEDLTQRGNKQHPYERVVTQSPWVLNSPQYLAKVCDLIRFDYDLRNVTAVDVYSFKCRKNNAERKDKGFWQKAEPSIDAWMLILGEVREVFDLTELVSKYPDVYKYIQRIRKSVRVQVLQPSCPVFRELERIRKEKRRVETGDREQSEDEQEEVELPKNTYWTVIKKLTGL